MLRFRTSPLGDVHSVPRLSSISDAWGRLNVVTPFHQALIAFRAARLEENMVAFVVAITLQHENCRPISDRDDKAIAEISKMLDAKQVKTDYNFFNALRAQPPRWLLFGHAVSRSSDEASISPMIIREIFGFYDTGFADQCPAHCQISGVILRLLLGVKSDSLVANPIVTIVENQFYFVTHGWFLIRW